VPGLHGHAPARRTLEAPREAGAVVSLPLMVTEFVIGFLFVVILIALAGALYYLSGCAKPSVKCLPSFELVKWWARRKGRR
jgi:hypothetical protein